MPYDYDEIYAQCMELIEEKDLFYVHDVITLLPIHRSTFYLHFPAGSDGLDNIKEALDRNKIKIKIDIRGKLLKGDRTSDLLALYKLVCTDEERQALSMGDVNVNIKHDDQPDYDLGRLTPEERQIWYKLYNKACGKIETIDIDHEEIKPKKLKE